MLVTVRTLSALALRRISVVKLGGGGVVSGSGLSAGLITAITLSVAAVILRMLVMAFLVFY